MAKSRQAINQLLDGDASDELVESLTSYISATQNEIEALKSGMAEMQESLSSQLSALREEFEARGKTNADF